MTYPKIAAITPNEYQDQIVELSKHYAIYGTPQALPTYSHGLFEECGEVAGLLKRYYRGDPQPDLKNQMTKELGDAIAYLALVADKFDIDLETIMIQNIDKIQRRKEEGTLTGTGSDR